MGTWHKEPIQSGAKKITIRDRDRVNDDPYYRVGDTIEIVSSDGTWGCTATITHANVYTYETIPENDWSADEFESLDHMFAGMASYYRHIKWSDDATIIRWSDVRDWWEE